MNNSKAEIINILKTIRQIKDYGDEHTKAKIVTRTAITIEQGVIDMATPKLGEGAGESAAK